MADELTSRDRFGQPTKPMEGKGVWRCNRTACQVPIASRWWNTSTRAWYCEACATRINEVHVICYREGEVPTDLPPGFHGPEAVAP